MPGSERLGILVIFEKAVSCDSNLGETNPVVVYRVRRAFVGSVSCDLNLGEAS